MENKKPQNDRKTQVVESLLLKPSLASLSKWSD